MSILRRSLCANAAFAILAAISLAGEPVYFRSDHGVAETSPSQGQDFQLDQPLWRMPMDGGHSTPTLSNGRLFLTTYRASDQRLATLALDARDGKIVWEQVVPKTQLEAYHRATGSPAAATTACDGERVYSFFGSYGLICHDVNGRQLWERRLGPFQDEFGASSSPVLVNDKLILNEDHDLDSFLVALNCRTGEILWKTPRPEAVRSYSTPAVWTREGRTELLVAGALELAAYAPATGEKLWWVRGLARIVIPVPVPWKNMIFMASWTPGGDSSKRLTLDPWSSAAFKWDRNHDGKLARGEIESPEILDRFFRMDLDQSGSLDQGEWERHAAVFQKAQNAILGIAPGNGTGDLTGQAIQWKHLRGAPYVSTPVATHGILWVVKDGGLVTKLDAASGELLQEERLPGMGNYYASPVAAGDRVLFAGELGTINVLAATRTWQIVATHDLHEKIYATPVVHQDRLYLRTEGALYCFPRKTAHP